MSPDLNKDHDAGPEAKSPGSPEYPNTSSQGVINAALDDYVQGGEKGDARQELLGFSVLRHASEAQLRAVFCAATVVAKSITEPGPGEFRDEHLSG